VVKYHASLMECVETIKFSVFQILRSRFTYVESFVAAYFVGKFNSGLHTWKKQFYKNIWIDRIYTMYFGRK